MSIVNIEKIGAIIRDVAAQEVLPRWKNLQSHEILEKTGPKDLVTVADRACEKALGPRLMAELAGSIVVGEEGVAADPDTFNKLEGSHTAWIIDPIDGTSHFAKGAREFDVMVGLAKGRELLGGWIYSVVDDDLYMAEKGSGVVLRRFKVPTSGDAKVLPVTPAKVGESLSDFTGILGRANFTEEERAGLKARHAHFKKWSSTICAGHDYARLVRGEAQFAIFNKCMAWDHVPGLALVQELGFKYARVDGSPYQLKDPSGGLLVAPAEKWDDIKKVLFG